MRAGSLASLVAGMLVAVPARAHIGALVSPAVFTAPAAPAVVRADGGLSVAPYTFAQADASFDVHWTVTPPNDPTARFSFYYLDYAPQSAITYDQILSIAAAIPEASGDNAIWVSCTCDADAGVICPDAGSRIGKCGITQFTWNTAAIPAGAYWLIALDKDPPYQVYTVSGGPVRVAHNGAALPPASAVVLPDGLAAFDLSIQTLWIATGQPPLHFNVFYGVDDQAHALDAPKPLGTDIAPIKNADGTYSYDWDVSTYANGPYYFAVEVSDATGQKSATRSLFGAAVYHPQKTDGGASPSDGGAEVGTDGPPNDAAIAADDEQPEPGNADGFSWDVNAGEEDGTVGSTDGDGLPGSSASDAAASGGCGCRASGAANQPTAMAAAIAVIVVGARRRRRGIKAATSPGSA